MKTKMKYKVKKAYLGTTIALLTIAMSTINIFGAEVAGADAGGADAGGAGGGGLDGPGITDGVNAGEVFKDVLLFILEWIGVVGIGVAVLGAVQLAFAIKSNNADKKSEAILEMVGGFVVLAISGAANLFGIV
jgi:hypothetical protein